MVNFENQSINFVHLTFSYVILMASCQHVIHVLMAVAVAVVDDESVEKKIEDGYLMAQMTVELLALKSNSSVFSIDRNENFHREFVELERDYDNQWLL